MTQVNRERERRQEMEEIDCGWGAPPEDCPLRQLATQSPREWIAEQSTESNFDDSGIADGIPLVRLLILLLSILANIAMLAFLISLL